MIAGAYNTNPAGAIDSQLLKNAHKTFVNKINNGSQLLRQSKSAQRVKEKEDDGLRRNKYDDLIIPLRNAYKNIQKRNSTNLNDILLQREQLINPNSNRGILHPVPSSIDYIQAEQLSKHY